MNNYVICILFLVMSIINIKTSCLQNIRGINYLCERAFVTPLPAGAG